MMGLFSKVKKEEKSSEEGVPVTLPDTVMDKLYSGNSKSVNRTSSADRKKIPPEIVHERGAAKSRIPVHETHYVNLSNEVPVHEPVEEHRPVEESHPKRYIPREEAELKNSFFHHLEDLLRRKDRKVNEYSSRDLLNKMKEYHESLKTGHSFFLHEGDAEEQISRKIDSLKELESDWVTRRKELDAAELFLTEKELEIETKFEELKQMMNHADKHALYNRKALEGKEFVMKDGKILSSVNELLYALPRMKNEVFHYHVNATKNDFSAWIRWVFDSEDLANAVSSSDSRENMIESLKEF